MKNLKIRYVIKDLGFSQAGFTLLELLTSIFIIALMTGVFLVNYHQAERKADLIFSTQSMISDIRFAQANALGLFKYDEVIPAGGWGVYFNINHPGKYIIFADEDGNYQYDEGEAEEGKGGREIILPSGLEINALQLIDKEDDPSQPDELHIVFLPPDPLTFINQEYIDHKEAIISLREIDSGEISQIKVNFAGLVELLE